MRFQIAAPEPDPIRKRRFEESANAPLRARGSRSARLAVDFEAISD